MASQQQLNTVLSCVFFSNITNLYPQSQRQYDCTGISDLHYCQLGVLRCLSSSVTRQEFLQYHADQNVADIYGVSPRILTFSPVLCIVAI